MSKEIDFKVKHYAITLAKEISSPYLTDGDDVVKNSRDIKRVVKNIFFDIAPDYSVRETFLCFCMDRKGRITSVTTVGVGGISAVHVDVKLIAFHAVNCLASSVIVAHNHPSGNSKPSVSDVAITKNIRDGLKFLGIELLDHIILTKNLSYSFADEGML